MPTVLHWGADLGDLSTTALEAFADSSVPPVGPSSLDAPLRLGIVPLAADGWSGLPGLEGRHDPIAQAGRTRRPVLRLEKAELTAPGSVSVSLLDDADGAPVLRVVVELELDDTGVLRSRTRVINLAATPYEFAAVASVLPLPAVAQERLDFTGVWAAERVPQRGAINDGTALRESRHGRGGHDDAFVTVAGISGFGFGHGEVWAMHLGWSGDKRTWIDRSAIGYTTIGAGELVASGEVRLAEGEEYASPWALAAWSAEGLDGLSARFHGWFRSRPAHPSGPRPLTFNSWEAVYFDKDAERLEQLADLAASVGVERFVLDDGWMTGRTDERRALGDWVVDPSAWPNGLTPLVERVRAAGMQFGLWVEPEMVSLDSILAREHPEWVLREASARLPQPWRHQYVLDLANEEAREHVRDALLALLDEYPIDYLKWDMNRDQLGGSVHRQVHATYRLMDELRQRHPHLEIESCSSGGARIDAGILERTQRVWASDTNDPHDRQQIVRWTSLLVPPEYIGSHVGSSPAHVTGRSHSLGFRLATALLGHAGIEWDLSTATEGELSVLRAWSQRYRELRSLIHGGRLVRSDDDGDLQVTGVIQGDADDAIFWVASLAASKRTASRLPGLDATRSYRVTVVDLGAPPATQPGTTPPWWTNGSVTLPGSVLTSTGLELPLLLPDEAIVLRVTAV